MTKTSPIPGAKPFTADVAGAPKFNILVVDDRPENLLAFETILAPLAQNVVAVRSGSEALRELLNRKFAVILLDVKMAAMDGYETAALIRQRPASQYTPIIFVTAGGPNDTHVSRGYSLGAVDYLFAPVDPEVMRTKVSVFIELARKAAIINEQAELLRAAAERRAARVENRMQSLLNRLQVGVYRATPEGALLDANPAFLRLLRLSAPDDPAIRSVKEVVTGLSLPALLGCQGALDFTSPSTDHQLELPDGMRIWVSLSKAVMAPEPDQICVDGVLADISERKAHERVVKESNRALQRSNEDLNQFAYAASHDLEEPLRQVAQRGDSLRRRLSGKLDAEADGALGFIVDSSRGMEQRLKDLLLYAHIAHSSNEIAASLIAADRALDVAMLNLRSVIEETGAVITRDTLPTITMQETHLVQLFQNLLANAIKFRREERPAIHVSCERADTSWRFSVSDNGIGIPPEFRTQIFGVFKRVHGRQSPGTGIGLAICSKIVERYGGDLWVESEVGCGSTFYFTAR
jgi:signal transduction histidine kinase